MMTMAWLVFFSFRFFFFFIFKLHDDDDAAVVIIVVKFYIDYNIYVVARIFNMYDASEKKKEEEKKNRNNNKNMVLRFMCSTNHVFKKKDEYRAYSIRKKKKRE